MSIHDDDYLCWDDVEAGSVILKRAASTTVSIAVMMRGLLSKTDLEFAGIGADAEAVSWSIPNILLNPTALGRKIKKGDVIVGADNARFTVVSSDLAVAGSHWYVASVPER